MLNITHRIFFTAIIFLMTSCASNLPRESSKRFSSDAYNSGLAKLVMTHCNKTGVCDSPPKLIRGGPPHYPGSQSKLRKSGYAKVKFDIEPTGKVSNVRLISSTAPAFGKVTVRHVKTWKYKPAMLNGKPVKLYNLVQNFPFIW